MKIIQESKEKTGKTLYTEKYELRYCTGSVELDDESNVIPPKKDAEKAE